MAYLLWLLCVSRVLIGVHLRVRRPWNPAEESVVLSKPGVPSSGQAASQVCVAEERPAHAHPHVVQKQLFHDSVREALCCICGSFATSLV
jgi:hypothetical protein